MPEPTPREYGSTEYYLHLFAGNAQTPAEVYRMALSFIETATVGTDAPARRMAWVCNVLDAANTIAERLDAEVVAT
jgi:hypothetical protein